MYKSPTVHEGTIQNVMIAGKNLFDMGRGGMEILQQHKFDALENIASIIGDAAVMMRGETLIGCSPDCICLSNDEFIAALSPHFSKGEGYTFDPGTLLVLIQYAYYLFTILRS